MLYAFHSSQATKNPKSIHATYLVSGTKNSATIGANGAKGKNGEDTVMDSSPFPSSWMETPTRDEPEIAVKTVTLVKEEDFEGICSRRYN
jgi:DNA polymerase delta subunit 3